MVQRLLCRAGILVACGLAPAGCGENPPAPPSAADAPPAATTTTTPIPTPSPTQTPAAPPRAPESTVGPRLAFASKVLEFGRISDTKPVTRTFTFTNPGDAVLQIKEVAASCRCTVPDLRRKVLNPGESGEINVEFDPRGRVGDTSKTITIISNSILEPALRLTVHATVDPMLRYQRNHKLGVIELGQGHRSVVHLSYDDPDLTIRDVTTNSPLLTARLLGLGEPGPVVNGVQTYEGAIEITVSPDAPWGILYATRVEFMALGRPDPRSDPVDMLHHIYVTGDVYGELRAKPSALAFGRLSANEPYEHTVTIFRPSGEPFTVSGARVSDCDLPGVQARVEPVSPSEYRIVLSGSAVGHRGGFRGTVTITTDVPDEETIGVGFAGLVY